MSAAAARGWGDGGGIFAGLTNQRSAQPGMRAAGRRCAVAGGRAGGAGAAGGGGGRLPRQLTPGDYGPSNPFYGDGRGCGSPMARLAAAVEVVDLMAAPGVMVLANDRPGSPHLKAARDAKRATALVVPAAAVPALWSRCGVSSAAIDCHRCRCRCRMEACRC